MSSALKKTLQQANEAVTRGDHEAFLSFCTDNTKWTFVGERTLEGKAAVREYMAGAYKQPPRFHVERMIAEGDFLTAIGQFALTDASGKTAEYAYCDVWRFEDGKLAELRAYVVELGKPT